MKKILTISFSVLYMLCPIASVVGRPKPPAEPLDERPISNQYFFGTAKTLTKRAPIEGEDKAKGSIKVAYASDELAVLHTTAWILDGDDVQLPSKWNEVSPSINDHNGNPMPVPPKLVDAGDHTLHFWAQTALDIPPDVLKVRVEAGVQTTVIVQYNANGSTFPNSQVKARKSADKNGGGRVKDTGSTTLATPVTAAVAAGYGQLKEVDQTVGHTTSWSIDGGAWRATGTTANVYAGTHVIQFRADKAGDIPPPARNVTVNSKQLVAIQVKYTP